MSNALIRPYSFNSVNTTDRTSITCRPGTRTARNVSVPRPRSSVRTPSA
jgi:hypothetical protein